MRPALGGPGAREAACRVTGEVPRQVGGGYCICSAKLIVPV